jgi:glutathione S-transferase
VEEPVRPGTTAPDVLAISPLGKIPFIRTPQGGMCESHAILEYVEAAYPDPALVPAEPFAAGKVRELMLYIDLHLELVARELYGQAFFGGSVPEETQARVKQTLQRNIAGLKTLIRFEPYIAGYTFTLADVVAFNNLPLVGMATRAVYGEDLLIAAGVDYKPFIKLIGERASAQKVAADRRTSLKP